MSDLEKRLVGAPVGDDPGRCTATAKRTGERCSKWAVAGASVCRSHGGGAPQVRAAARKRVAQERAAKSLAEVELSDEDIDPVEELLDWLKRVRVVEDWLADQVAQLDTKLDSLDDHARREALPVVQLWTEALDRTGKALLDVNKLGLEERMTQVKEAQAIAVGAALDAALAEAEVPPDLQDRIRAELATQLRRRMSG